MKQRGRAIVANQGAESDFLPKGTFIGDGHDAVGLEIADETSVSLGAGGAAFLGIRHTQSGVTARLGLWRGAAEGRGVTGAAIGSGAEFLDAKKNAALIEESVPSQAA